MSFESSLQKHDQETSNWTYFWLRKSAERFAGFLLPSTANPKSDLMDPPWLTPSQEENPPIISFMTRNQEHDHAIDILSLLGNYIDHGAWLSGWCAARLCAKRGNGLFSAERVATGAFGCGCGYNGLHALFAAALEEPQLCFPYAVGCLEFRGS